MQKIRMLILDHLQEELLNIIVQEDMEFELMHMCIQVIRFHQITTQ